jgi:hypothetical protein
MRYIILAVAAICAQAAIATAHEMTPTYFELRPSSVENVWRTKMYVFNRREDAEWYGIEVYDADWNPIEYASFDRIVQLKEGEGKEIELLVRQRDRLRVEYICSRSIDRYFDGESSAVSSLICSKRGDMA